MWIRVALSPGKFQTVIGFLKMKECAPSDDGLERFACPTPDRMGRYRCIDDHMLCDGFIDCAAAEDEDRMSCMFYKTTKAHLDVLADALLRWARGRY
ncbi:uncharacterized protein LOC113470828 [Trichonephila clavata]|uniref:Uncharacterized protein LOC113470828 n=1 Tax=Trichonephila clavata TaxID=2740835 RepID=A0A8X6GG46_TRICU|nr:uncharacterized protein LOC113470828 [Trichonephila clavata]